MGVHGLWELLSPVGHRVSNDNVRNKILAVDISIWLTQFVKAMRDAEGAQVRNSHLLGVFRRCVKLLYLSVKPVLVFDGATPALKRRTLSSRRAQREKHAAKLRRLAEKMLLNRIKQKTVGNAIAKKRKGKLGRISRTPERTLSLRDELNGSSPEIEKCGPASKELTGCERETIQLLQNADRLATIGDKPLDVQDPVNSSNLPYEDSDIDDIQIRVPRNVDDLDDEVLMKLPTKLQAEVFKQVKLEQRARHRENMLLKRQDPSEFSKMQIEGFLRHTALNRKISRVRNVINSKSGASQRIASDGGRNFILEEVAFMRTARRIEANESDDGSLKTPSPEVNSAVADKNDLLADIRARKEATLQGSAGTTTKRPKTLMQEPRHRESGTGWASKVLEDGGGLTMRLGVPGNSGIKGDSQLSFGLDDDSHVRLKEELRLPRKTRENTRTNHAALEKEKGTMDSSISDDDEWEDGDQPIIYDFSGNFGNDLRRSDREASKVKDGLEREELPNLLGPPSRKHVSPNGERGYRKRALGACHESIHEMVPGNENGQTTTCSRDPTAQKGKSKRVRAVWQSLDRTSAAFDKSTAIPERSREQHKDESKCGDYKEGNPRSASEETHRGGDVVGLQCSNNTPSRANAAFSQFTVDAALAQARVAPAEDREVQSVSFVGSEERTDPAPISRRRETWRSENREDGIRVEPSIPTRKGIVTRGGHTCSPLQRSMASNENQAIRGHKTEIGRINVHAERLSSSRQSKRTLPSTNYSKSSNSPERVMSKTHNDEEYGNGVSPRRSNTGSPERSPDEPPALKAMHAADEVSYDSGRTSPRDLLGQKEAQEPSFADLESMQEELEVEAREITRQQSLHQGGADSVADEMYAETRDLIKLFGIPYLEAPMEAEAQCAFLNMERIVDGVLTEDSDAFLFGAATVYRHLFAEGRFAEAYEADDIQLSLGLDRKELIRLAYLLGSDYTAGVRGVGIVNSMEILEAFPGSSGLEEFREWTKSVTVLDKAPGEEVMSGKNPEAVRRRFCWKHRNMKRNWEVREGFPNPAIFKAYMNPEVDRSRERFTWGPINFEGLAKFCWDKFGWEMDRFDSTVGPLRQKLEEQSGMTQRRIDEFFKPHRFAKIRSERLQRAVHGMAGEMSKELMAAQGGGRRMQKMNPIAHSAQLSDQIDRKVEDPEDSTGRYDV